MSGLEGFRSQARNRLSRIGITGTTLLFAGAAFAFAGPGVLMFNMSRDMSEMTRVVSQMGRDVSSMAGDMGYMVGDMDAMAESMVEGQTGMAGELARVRVGADFMVHDMRSMNRNIDDLTVSIRRMSGDMAGMDDATAQMNRSVFAVNEAMGRMSVDMNRMTRPESLAPMSPFR